MILGLKSIVYHSTKKFLLIDMIIVSLNLYFHYKLFQNKKYIIGIIFSTTIARILNYNSIDKKIESVFQYLIMLWVILFLTIHIIILIH